MAILLLQPLSAGITGWASTPKQTQNFPPPFRYHSNRQLPSWPVHTFLPADPSPGPPHCLPVCSLCPRELPCTFIWWLLPSLPLSPKSPFPLLTPQADMNSWRPHVLIVLLFVPLVLCEFNSIFMAKWNSAVYRCPFHYPFVCWWTCRPCPFLALWGDMDEWVCSRHASFVHVPRRGRAESCSDILVVGFWGAFM